MLRLDNQENRARVGIPYRTHNEQVRNVRAKYEMYLRAVEAAGGTPVEVSLSLSAGELRRVAGDLDAVVLPGSPADVDPARYRSVRGSRTADADVAREDTDLALLEHCFGERKPVLAICYGVQILNVYLEGTLIQDIASEMRTSIQHAWTGQERGAPEPFHRVTIESASRTAGVVGEREPRVNSSHHQCIQEPGRGLRVAARASDGIIEAVEWSGDSNWVTGVQWHPERMVDDLFAQALFRDFITAARKATVHG